MVSVMLIPPRRLMRNRIFGPSKGSPSLQKNSQIFPKKEEKGLSGGGIPRFLVKSVLFLFFASSGNGFKDCPSEKGDFRGKQRQNYPDRIEIRQFKGSNDYHRRQ